MLPWFLRDNDLLTRERRVIEELQRSVDWLTGAEWRIHNGDLCLDVVIRVHGHDYEMRMQYPSLFPDAPISICPLKMEARLSGHQYGGSDGPLCLEYGPDNWHRELTGVQMLESTYRLLEIENPLGENKPKLPLSAPSRHHLTAGQELRGARVRWYSSEGLHNLLIAQPKRSIGNFKFSLRKIGDDWIVLVHEAMPVGGETWKDVAVPTTLPEGKSDELGAGSWLRTNLDPAGICKISSLAELKGCLWDMDLKILVQDGSQKTRSVLIVDQSGDLHMFLLLSDETLMSCSKVLSEKTAANVRVPDSAILNGKSVGIVGLGSAGSKIAVSLARMGVRQFYLVDHDVLLPENLHRHALDWQNVTRHKVDAIKTAVSQIAPDAKIAVSRLHLTGQESAPAVSGVLKKLSECDLIIDATANPKVFNLLAAIVKIAKKSIVWLEVFGGGIGGFVARSRHGVDPSSQYMRAAYLQFCTDNPHSAPGTAAHNYAVEDGDGNVLAATDADIAIIAHHAARLAVDCFISPESSKYPYSMYLVGLNQAWVFEAPFATIPISAQPLSSEASTQTGKEAELADNLKFISELVTKALE